MFVSFSGFKVLIDFNFIVRYIERLNKKQVLGCGALPYISHDVEVIRGNFQTLGNVSRYISSQGMV